MQEEKELCLSFNRVLLFLLFHGKGFEEWKIKCHKHPHPELYPPFLSQVTYSYMPLGHLMQEVLLSFRLSKAMSRANKFCAGQLAPAPTMRVH